MSRLGLGLAVNQIRGVPATPAGPSNTSCETAVPGPAGAMLPLDGVDYWWTVTNAGAGPTRVTVTFASDDPAGGVLVDVYDGACGDLALVGSASGSGSPPGNVTVDLPGDGGVDQLFFVVVRAQNAAVNVFVDAAAWVPSDYQLWVEPVQNTSAWETDESGDFSTPGGPVGKAWNSARTGISAVQAAGSLQPLLAADGVGVNIDTDDDVLALSGDLAIEDDFTVYVVGVIADPNTNFLPLGTAAGLTALIRFQDGNFYICNESGTVNVAYQPPATAVLIRVRRAGGVVYFAATGRPEVDLGALGGGFPFDCIGVRGGASQRNGNSANVYNALVGQNRAFTGAEDALVQAYTNAKYGATL